ncbi:T9SS type A sorting domain-containing protein [Saccharicrinis sp. FJH62]|uniref:right-handed parallel beta-helix repeat-containing protein n=1 Tax=Saccharicrinis sp. FJH62 TaxID=3344657 RepID=UPI0035D4C22A
MKKEIYIVLGMLIGISVVVRATSYYVATDGSDTNQGTIDQPLASLQKGQEKASPGDTVFVRGGTYQVSANAVSNVVSGLFACVTYLDKSGQSGKLMHYFNYPGERPVFDFSSVKPSGQRVVAIYVRGDYIHIRGFEMTGVQVTITDHTESYCIYSRGNYNIYENLIMHDNKGTGIRHYGGGHNLFLNCDAYRNHDDVSEDGRGGNTDGFGCHPGDGGIGNVFRGCRAWFNSDDGFDCIRAREAITYENCQAFYNGYSPTFQSLGDGNGFKAGGFAHDVAADIPSPVPSHTVRSCLAVNNKANGFYSNHHLNGNRWYNNTAYRNGVNYNMVNRESPESDNINVNGYDHVLVNNLGYKARSSETAYIDLSQNTLLTNSFDNSSVTVSDADFLELNEYYITLPRNLDGTIPDNDFMHLAPGSDLIDAGTVTGKPYYGKAPDIGAFEYEPGEAYKPSAAVGFAISPNPVKSYINLDTDEYKDIKIIDATGKVSGFKSDFNKLDVSDLNTGIYILKLIANNGNMLTSKFVKL